VQVANAGTQDFLSAPQASTKNHGAEEIKKLEEEFAALREEVQALKQQFAEFRKQFE
jgi:molecular chaperone GrpE (heat shock protein)